MKLAFKILGLFIITSVIFISVVSFLALQSQPQFKNYNAVNVQAATQSKAAAKRFIDSLKNKKQPVLLSLSQIEINGLNALLNRAFPQISSDVIIQDEAAKIKMSIELPFPNAFKYLNISGDLHPSTKGINLGDVNVGGLTFSGNQLVSFSRWFVDWFIQDKLGTNLVSMVQWVTLNDKHIRTSLFIPQEMNELNKSSSALFALRDNLALFGDVQKIKFYHHALADHLDQLKKPASKNRKLAYYIQFMFTLAHQQTSVAGIGKAQNQKRAVQENYSALMALALYFGSDTFELLVGDVSTLNEAQIKKRNFLRNKVTLRNRIDLQKHFIYSIALQLFGNSSASDAIGEIKEFLDSNPGGSGFSFADLMADRAGTRLAKLATTSETSALRLQKLFSKNIEESDFMPEIHGIPEGISADTFNLDYRDVDSQEYKNMISILDERLAELTLYD